MPIYVSGNSSSSNINDNEIETSLFVQKPYLRSLYMEANIEGDVDMKNQFKNKNLPCPQGNSDAVCIFYVDNLFKYLNIYSITLNKQAENDDAHVDQFHQENEQSRQDFGLDFYDESSDIVKINQDIDLNDNNLTN